MKCDGCFGASFNDCEMCNNMTEKENQNSEMMTCGISNKTVNENDLNEE